MQVLVQVAEEFQIFCESNGWQFSIIGGLALQFWGEERLTKDIDLTILTEYRLDAEVIDRILAKYEPRIENARQFALNNRVLLLKHCSGVGIDVSLGALPFEQNLVNRAKKRSYGGIDLLICSAEDLIVLKTFASRPQDWIDIERVIAKHKVEFLDWSLIESELKPLLELKEEPENFDRLLLLKTRVSKVLKG